MAGKKKTPTTEIPVTQDDVSASESEDELTAHEPVMFTGDFPGPTGNIPTKISDLDLFSQRRHASEFYAFLNDDSHFLELNSDTTPRIALINVPQTSRVRVTYATGFGSKGIGQASDISGK
jgi:hypothetical protein